MSQTNVDFSQNPSGAQLMDDFLAKMQENILTSNSGLQRPEYAQEGIVWLDKTTTPWTYKFFDGTDDIIIGQFDVENNKFIPSDPMTTAGDLIVEGEDGNPTRLAPGIAGTVLTSNGAGKLPSYQKSDYQLVSNLSQIIDGSTSKYPSNKAVQDIINSLDLTNKANIDLSNVSANIDYVVEQGTSGNISWEKWKSGKLVQYGFKTYTNTGVSQNTDNVINFVKPYKTNPKVVTGYKFEPVTYASGGIFTTSISTTQFIFRCISYAENYNRFVRQIDWIAIGQGA